MTQARRRFHRDLARDRSGATVLEFALIFPMLCVLLLGGFDIAYQQYARAVLDGEVAKAARDSALESASSTTIQSTIDARVRTAMQNIAPQATFQFSRRSFSSYTRAATPGGEPFIDADSDGQCNNGESYQDSNRNSQFDRTDSGSDGFSGAKDTLMYTATASYPRLLPLGHLLGWSNDVTISSSTVLTIQPFDSKATVLQRTCT